MNSTNEQKKSNTANRGFASMDPEQQRAIARKGGNTVSRNKEHMAEIGSKGGKASGVRRQKKATNAKLREEGIEPTN